MFPDNERAATTSLPAVTTFRESAEFSQTPDFIVPKARSAAAVLPGETRRPVVSESTPVPTRSIPPRSAAAFSFGLDFSRPAFVLNLSPFLSPSLALSFSRGAAGLRSRQRARRPAAECRRKLCDPCVVPRRRDFRERRTPRCRARRTPRARDLQESAFIIIRSLSPGVLCFRSRDVVPRVSGARVGGRGEGEKSEISPSPAPRPIVFGDPKSRFDGDDGVPRFPNNSSLTERRQGVYCV